MKGLSEFITDETKINESTEYSVDYLDDVVNHIDELVDIICTETGINKKKLKLTVGRSRNDISIESNNLVEFFGELGPLMFKEINLITWQGKLYERDGEKYIYFNPKWAFSFHSGGSNGTDALFNGIRFIVGENKWVVGSRLYR